MKAWLVRGELLGTKVPSFLLQPSPHKLQNRLRLTRCPQALGLDSSCPTVLFATSPYFLRRSFLFKRLFVLKFLILRSKC